MYFNVLNTMIILYRKEVLILATDSQKRAQSKYNKKKTMFSAVFLPKEENISNILKTYLKDNKLSVNSYLRDLIVNDLKKKGLL